VIEPLDRVSDRVEGHQVLVDGILHRRSKSSCADDRPHIEKSSGDGGDSHSSGSLDQVDFVDTTATMNDNSLQLGAHTMRNKYVNARVCHSA